jgi:hypothetical protein
MVMSSLLKQKINDRLDALQLHLDAREHFTNPEHVLECIENITKFWSILEEDQKDFLDCSRYAVEKQIEWK